MRKSADLNPVSEHKSQLHTSAVHGALVGLIMLVRVWCILRLCSHVFWLVEYKYKPVLKQPLLSWRLPAENLTAALEHWKQQRAKDIDIEDEERDDLFITAGGPEYPEGRGKDFLEDVMSRILARPLSHARPDRDRLQMASFLKISKEAGFPAKLKVDQWMPGGSPAINYALLNRQLSSMDNYGGWQFPGIVNLENISFQSGIAKSSFKGIMVREFTLDQNADVDLIVNFINNSVEMDERNMPGIPMAFDIEEFKVCPQAYEYLCNWKHLPLEEQSRARNFKLPGYYDKGKNIVSRILLGNGLTWMCTLRFPWGPETVKNWQGKRLVFRPDRSCVKQVLEAIFEDKTVFGAGVINDVTGLDDFLQTVYDIDVKMPVPVETCALALAAGYRFPKTNLWFLQLLITGGVHNKQVSCADNLWGLPWDELPMEFKLYALADVKHSFMCYNVLMALCIGHMFPDPILPCEFLSLTQERCFEYISKLILAVLTNKRFHHDDFKVAKTRKELVGSLRSVGQAAKAGTPTELVWLGRLIPPWPTLPYGGARDFHTVAMFFAHSQADNLVQLRESLSQRRSQDIQIFTRDQKITPEEAATLTYGRDPYIPRTYLGTKILEPLPPRSDLTDKGYKVTGYATKDLLGQKSRTGQGLVPGMLEWLRTRSLKQGKQFLKDLGNLGEDLGKPEYRDVWVQKPALYQKLKSQLACRTNMLYESSYYMEKVITGKVDVVFKQEAHRENKMQEMIEYHASRKERLKASAMIKGRLPTAKIHLQGQQYKHHPRIKLLGTFKRRQRRMKEEDRNPTGTKKPINNRPKRLFKPKTKPGAAKLADQGTGRQSDCEEQEIYDARAIITSKQAMRPQPTDMGGQGSDRSRAMSPAPVETRDRSRSPRASTSYEPLATDMAAKDSYRRLRQPVTLANYMRGDHNRPEFRYQNYQPIEVNLQRCSYTRSVGYKQALESGMSIPEEHIDPIPLPHSPTGYSDISSDDLDFSQLGGYGKKKRKGKGKNKY